MGRLADEDPGLVPYLTQIERYEQLDRELELELARQYRHTSDARVAHRLVRANLRYVVRIALGYRGYGLRVADLIEEGNVGLLEAVERFDPDRNLRFMTYASYWIRAYILAHILKQRTLVTIGTGPLQSRLFFRLARERARITSALGKGATREEVDRQLATIFKTTPERIRDLGSRLEAKDLSLDQPRYHDGQTTALEQLTDEHVTPDADLESRELGTALRRRIEEVRRSLPERERYIVDHRLLSDSDDEETLAEIGRTLHLSRERVRQLEERIKLKLRRALEPYAPAT